MTFWTHYGVIMTALSVSLTLLLAVVGLLWKIFGRMQPLSQLVEVAEPLKTVAALAPAIEQMVEDHTGVPDRPGVPGRKGIMPTLEAMRGDILRLDEGQKFTHQKLRGVRGV